MSKYSEELMIYTDIMDDRVVALYRDATEEERQLAKELELGFIPKKIKVGEETEMYTLRKDAIYRKRFINIKALSIQQAFDRSGKLYRSRFIVEENGTKYLVKGNYQKFRNKLNNLDNTKIGYDKTT